MGVNKQGFLPTVLHTLHLAIWNFSSLAKTPLAQGSFVVHSSWNFCLWSYDFFNFLAGGQGTKLGAKFVSSRSFKSMTYFDDVGESTCKVMPFELGCAYVGSKRVAWERSYKRRNCESYRRNYMRCKKRSYKWSYKMSCKRSCYRRSYKETKKLQNKKL